VVRLNSEIQNLRSALTRLIEQRAIFKGEFRSQSGHRSDYYIDMAMIFTEPTGLEIAVNLILGELEKMRVDRIASPSVEADPMVAVVGIRANLGALFIHHGVPIYAYEKLENLLRGIKRVVIIADVTFGGSTVLAAARALRGAGAEVENAIVLVDLQEGARELLSANNVQLIPLIQAEDITELSRQRAATTK
jgi:orotate phosphoribosyltransferase